MTCEYGDTFIAGLKYKNIYAVQPHQKKVKNLARNFKKFIQN